jgi:hypothetical protein
MHTQAGRPTTTALTEANVEEQGTRDPHPSKVKYRIEAAERITCGVGYDPYVESESSPF